MCRYQSHFSHTVRLMTVPLFLGSLLGLSACGDSSIQVGSVTVVRHSKTITFNASNQGIVTVPCEPGEYLISGGFAEFGNLATSDPHQEALTGNFPSDAAGNPSTTPVAWTVHAGGVDGETIMAFVNCLKTSAPVQVNAVTNEHIYTDDGPFTQAASCPAGTLRTGGGILDGEYSLLSNAGDGTIGAMFPASLQDWTVTGSIDGTHFKGAYIGPVTVDVFAVCLTTTAFTSMSLASTAFSISPQQVATTTVCPTAVTYPSNCANDLRVNGTVACPAGQILLGGGYSDVTISPTPGIPFTDTNAAYVYGDTAQGDESAWLIQFQAFAYLVPGQPGGQGSATLWAVCGKPAPAPQKIVTLRPFPTAPPAAATLTPVPQSLKITPTPATNPTPAAPPNATPTPRPTMVPTIQFSLSPNTVNQTCSAPPDNALPGTQIVLDNTGSNVAVAWSAKAADLLPNSSTLWATTSPASGTIPAGQKTTVMLVPNQNLCNTLTGINPYAFRMVFTYAGGSTVTLTDSVTPFFIS